MNLEQKISTYIEQQFPEIYRDEGPFLVEFMKQYYVWLETDPTSPVYQARNYLANHDVDTTVDDFIIYFKEKYLKNIQLNTATNTKQLIKNSIDLYRSKGTENGIKLFFDLIFSAPSEVYYPGQDVFKLSDANWSIPKYVEVTSMPVNRLLVGRQIKGVYSGATAFVEKLVRRKVNNTYIEVFYISAINGDFQTGEIISLSSDNTYLITDFPVMLGSLTSLTVLDGGKGFAKGEIVTLSSNTGAQGKALVTDLVTHTGIVSFELKNGGWGYTSNAQINVSNSVLQLSNVQLATTDNTSLYERITTIVQPMANVQWYANTNLLNAGAKIYNYEANGQLRGVSVIMSAEFGTNATSNYYLLGTSYGNSAPYTPMPYTYYTEGNTNSFMVYNAGWVDVTATANVSGMSTNVDIICSGSASSFSNSEFVYQISSNNNVFARGRIIDTGNVTTNSFSVRVANLEGMFLTNFPLKGESNNGNVTINYCEFAVGTIDIVNSFKTLPGNFVHDTTANSLFSGTINQIPFGSGASISFDPDLLNTELVEVNLNWLRDYVDDSLQRNHLNAASYGAELNNANLNSPILGEALDFQAKTIGTIARLTQANPGSNYSYPPFVDAIDPLIASLNKMDFVIRINNPTGIYRTGELVTQTVNGAQGLIKFANTSEIHVQRLTYEDRWLAGTGNTYIIHGQSSGFTSTPWDVSYDIDGVAGHNAVISANVTISNNSVAGLSVYDSGFNFRDGDEVQFLSTDNTRAGTALGSVTSQGKASGYFKTTSGFLSSDKYLYDGYYYQDFSYEIRSPITVDRYSAMLKNILHVSGTKSFSAFLKNSSVDSTTKPISSVITQA